jgi:hypothetical protein
MYSALPKRITAVSAFQFLPDYQTLTSVTFFIQENILVLIVLLPTYWETPKILGETDRN